MKYLLLIYGDESAYASMSETEMQADMAAWWEFDSAIKESGASSSGEALQPTSVATTVREQNGEAVLGDGPAAQTDEQLGGYYLLDVEDLDAAIAWAKKCPGVKYGTIELRPIQEYPQG